MRAGMRIALLHLRVGVMNELQYRANFVVQLIQSVVMAGTGLIALSLIFDHTSDLNGWTRPQLLVVWGSMQWLVVSSASPSSRTWAG